MAGRQLPRASLQLLPTMLALLLALLLLLLLLGVARLLIPGWRVMREMENQGLAACDEEHLSCRPG